MQTDCRLCAHFKGGIHPLIINLILCGITGDVVTIGEGQCECFISEDDVIDIDFSVINSTKHSETETLDSFT